MPVVCLLFLLLLSPRIVQAQLPRPDSKLPITVKDFLTTWLINRDLPSALRFVSSNAIAGSCIIPERLANKKKLSKHEVLSIFREMLDPTDSPRWSKLDDVATSVGADLLGGAETISFGKEWQSYFHIYRLRSNSEASNTAFVCKFDDRESFRHKVAEAHVRYVITRLKSGRGPSLIFTSLWIPEKGNWRILTMEIGSDED